ncbi:MAG: ECF-type sigma factor [Rhodothermales bacterium]
MSAPQTEGVLMVDNRRMDRPFEVTRLLQSVRRGDDGARSELYRIVYDRLVGIADGQLARTNVETLNANDLVHEAYLKLLPALEIELSDRSHFFGIAANAMRQVLVDYARKKSSAKRGGGQVRVTLNGIPSGAELKPDDIISISDALDDLDQLNPRLRQVVEMRFFAGLEHKEIADALGITTRTVERDWAKAKLLLHRALYP